MALVHQPPLLLLDEPTTGVDIATRARLLEAIGELAREHGCAVLYSTHYLPEIEEMGASVAVLDRGRLLARGTLDELIDRHGSGLVELSFHGEAPAFDHLVDPAALTVDGATVLAKPRDIQRDPVKRSLEHLDLIIITREEATERGAMADAIKAATAAAEEAGMDAATAVQALEEAVALGEDPMAAAQHAVADAEHKAEEYSEAMAHEEAVEAAGEAAEADAAATEALAE